MSAHRIGGETPVNSPEETVELSSKKPKDRSAYNKAYLQANKKAILAKKKIYREANKGKISAMKAVYYEANKQELLEKAKREYRENRQARLEARKVYSAANRDKISARNRKSHYGLTPEDLSEMQRAQKYRCAICHTPFSFAKFHVDHDHSTGKARGLLCANCNSGLGFFRDDAQFLRRAIRYLK